MGETQSDSSWMGKAVEREECPRIRERWEAGMVIECLCECVCVGGGGERNKDEYH